jgi:hypothetical protein
VKTIEQREWLAMLEAELARRNARVEWDAGEDERAAQQFIEELQTIAGRLAGTAHLAPFTADDMSIVEMLSCRLFLPEGMQPAGLPSEPEIWAEYQRRRASV